MPVEPARPPLPDDPPKAKILIVDDDERTTLAVQTVLEELHQELVVAHSGEEALRALLFDDFAVILLDLHMPGMDGYETASLIRSRKRTRHVPILFLTAVFRDESHLFRAYSAGAVDMVFKPVDPFILKAKVSVFVDLHLKQVEIQREAQLRQRLQEENFRVSTEKLDTERNLRLSEETHRLLVDGVRDCAIYMLDEHGHVATWNTGAQRIKQYTAQEIIGQSYSRFFLEEDRQRGAPEQALAAAARDRTYEAEGWRVRKDGTLFWASVHINAVHDDDGRLVGFAKITRDITEKRETVAALERAREQLSQAQKMEAVGQLTGGIAHDFNNLLTVVLGNIDLLGDMAKDNEKTKRKIAAIKHAAERGRDLTSQLLAFSRRQHLAPTTLDVKSLVQGFDPLIRQAVGGAVVVKVDLPDAPMICDLDPSQFEATLLNLAVNARDAMPDGGTLTFEVRRIDQEPGLVARFPEAMLGPWIVLSARDTGCGMPKDVQTKAFEPFFTTKETGKGSGLGLSQVYGFVRQSGGFVTLSSTVGQGTELTLYLPPSDKPLPQKPPGHAPKSASTKSECILLVEDDSSVLALTTELLISLGYRVLSASTAVGALEILNRGDAIDLVFTDIIMPGGKSGIQLASEVKSIRPDIKVLLTSGYPGRAIAEQAENIEFPIVPKPFRQADLAQRLRSVLDGP